VICASFHSGCVFASEIQLRYW